MPAMTLYHATPSRSSIALWMLEETGAPYDIKLLKLSDNEQNQPAYLAVNPMGKVPALKVGDVVITEVAAICAYLADEYPDKKLADPDWRPAARALFQVAVFRAERNRAGRKRQSLPAQGAAAPRARSATASSTACSTSSPRR